MVGMVVAEDHIGHLAEIYAKLRSISEHGLWTGSGIEQYGLAVCLDQCLVSPLADALEVGDHRRESCYFEETDLVVAGIRIGVTRGSIVWPSHGLITRSGPRLNLSLRVS